MQVLIMVPFRVGRLYSSGDYSDLVISCRGEEHNVHKAIVCTQSEFVAAACRIGFKVSWHSPDACGRSNLTNPCLFRRHEKARLTSQTMILGLYT